MAELAIKRVKAVSISRATEFDAAGIIRLVNNESDTSGATLGVTRADISKWIRGGNSFVARLDSEPIGHGAIDIWPESGWQELRAAVVSSPFRNNGIYSALMAHRIIRIVEEDPQATMVVLKNSASMGWGLLLALGFNEVPNSKVPTELFSIGDDQQWTALVARRRDLHNLLLLDCARKKFVWGSS